ncbi:conserved protein of unknown function [Candidatus Filomicrobium marinum]|uniref:Uncharacterized protein n=2 Tax=Filomicrobium TaxID=119044 RepID=A0A0D6J9S1_9HYPH|nr:MULTISPECIES: hypothetical protein [Filomicrobium]MCV0368701.1 hypothetical protein [Filomicrobium sp.]CFW99877.1 conserved protein of unknown function [Candidatus Filomicrobium marinum]CPR15129.1 conserved protein of unknown function [Candidatus Filomicrobium marinum]SDO70355.1 hypothetical protein SAMN04488061_1432 [Filomicrobium insigne]
MAKKDQQTTKRAAPAKTARKASKSGVTLKKLETEARALKKERDSLRAELTAAKKRIAELEAINENAVNRIDWVLDSLHTLLEKKS